MLPHLQIMSTTSTCADDCTTFSRQRDNDKTDPSTSGSEYLVGHAPVDGC